MINDESRRKLREMNLGEIISRLEAQQADPATLGLPFDDRMQRRPDSTSTIFCTQYRKDDCLKLVV